MIKIFFIFCLFFIFLNANSVKQLTSNDFHSIIDGSLPAFVKFYAPWCGHCKRFEPEYEIVGKAFEKFKDKVIIARIDCDSEENKPICTEYGIQGFPTLNWFPKGETKNPTKYSGGRTADDVIKFINENAGVSARVPGKEPSFVVDLTDSTFDSIVLNKNKNVFVEFYAPWCGHCKSLAPIYEKLGKVYATDEDIVIARIDADGNKEAGSRFGIQGFPTLKYFPKNNKEGEDYDGGRDLNELVKNINEKFGGKRTIDGRLDSTAGRVDSLDKIIKKLSEGVSKDDVKKQLNEAISSLSGSDAKHGSIYVALVDKYSSNFVENEINRLTRLIESGSVASKKIDDFTKRINILRAF